MIAEGLAGMLTGELLAKAKKAVEAGKRLDAAGIAVPKSIEAGYAKVKLALLIGDVALFMKWADMLADDIIAFADEKLFCKAVQDPAPKAAPAGRRDSGDIAEELRAAERRGDVEAADRLWLEYDAAIPCPCPRCGRRKAEIAERAKAREAKDAGACPPPAAEGTADVASVKGETPTDYFARRLNEAAQAIAKEASEKFGVEISAEPVTATPAAGASRRESAIGDVLESAANLVGRKWPYARLDVVPTGAIVGLGDELADYLDGRDEADRAMADDEDADIDDVDMVVDLRHEAYREYVTPGGFTEDGEEVVIARIENPLKLGIRRGGETHRVLGSDGVVTMVPGQSRGNVVRYRPRDAADPFGFRSA